MPGIVDQGGCRQVVMYAVHEKRKVYKSSQRPHVAEAENGKLGALRRDSDCRSRSVKPAFEVTVE
jgi:hypothetical protein